MTNDETTDLERTRFATEMPESFGDIRELGLIDESARKATLGDLRSDESEPPIVPLGRPRRP